MHMIFCQACSAINLTSKPVLFRLNFKVKTSMLFPQEIICIVLICFYILKYLGACLHKENEEVEDTSNKFKSFK